jgi:hypothetical protein
MAAVAVDKDGYRDGGGGGDGGDGDNKNDKTVKKAEMVRKMADNGNGQQGNNV